MPRLLGILNLSADSFSDGGRFCEVDKAVEHARSMHAGGAWGIDIGAVSSNPDGEGLDAGDEIRRLEPVLAALRDARIPVSIDTFASKTQCWAGSRVEMLNDIRGFADPSIYDRLADQYCDLVVMHAVQDGRADRRSTDESTIVDRVLRFFDARLEALTAAGISEGRLIIDPGMGFFLGDRPEPSLAVLRAIPTLRAHTGRPVLISVSRKSFLGALIGGRPPQGRAAATLAAELYAAAQGADWIRTHDPVALADALKIVGHLDRDAR